MKIVLNDAFFDKKTADFCIKLLLKNLLICFIIFLA